MIRLLICDDSSETRSALRAALGDQSEIEIVGEAGTGQEAVALAAALSPDAVLMDVTMPLLDGVGATRRIRRLLPTARIVAFAGSSDDDVVNAMLDAGADSYCVKGSPLSELERAIAGASEPFVRLAYALARSVNGGGAGALVARELSDLTGGAVVGVYLGAPDAALSLVGHAGPCVETMVDAPAPALHAFEAGAPVLADGAMLSELDRRGCSCSEAIAVPLLCDGSPLGSIFAAMPASAGLLLDAKLVSVAADLAAPAVAIERRLPSRHTEARRDALTGLPNRRAFDERLDDLLVENRSLGIAVLDLDDFRQINDRHGHEAGDAVLRTVARVAQRDLRAGEELYRIGDDEFALLIEDDHETVPLVLGRLRRSFLAHRLSRPLPTVSAGVARSPEHGRSKSRLLGNADSALRGAKRAGKNRIAVAGGGLLGPVPAAEDGPRPHVLVVDDDASIRALLRTTLEAVDLDVDEADSAGPARIALSRRRPSIVVLDIGLPGTDGLTFCHELKTDPRTADVAVVILTGADDETYEAARNSPAEALLRKPFSPLDLLGVVERLLGRADADLASPAATRRSAEQLLLYAEDLRRLLERERSQRSLLQDAYRKTVGVLAAALESKDVGTGAHSQRVQLYASELAQTLEPTLLDDPSVEYGFLLHDVGKIGIPDRILQKPGPLTPSERRVLETHTLLGEQMLSSVPLLEGEGLRIVRSHHERWDGRGYPDGIGGSAISIGARVFAVADALDAMTSDRPYRAALSWDEAVAEIVGEAAGQFDPDTTEAFEAREPSLYRIYSEVRTGSGASE